MGNSESDPLDSWTPSLGIQIFTTIYLQPQITTQGTVSITFRPDGTLNNQSHQQVSS